MKRSLLLPIQAVTEREREREKVQREKRGRGWWREEKVPPGFPPMNLGENTAPHPSLQEGLVLRACLFGTKGWQANRLREVKGK